MTTTEAKEYLESMVPETKDLITLKSTEWADFKQSMLGFLDNPGVNTKYKTAIEQIDTIVQGTLTT
jgi:hypothetical protein